MCMPQPSFSCIAFTLKTNVFVEHVLRMFCAFYYMFGQEVQEIPWNFFFFCDANRTYTCGEERVFGFMGDGEVAQCQEAAS